MQPQFVIDGDGYIAQRKPQDSNLYYYNHPDVTYTLSEIARNTGGVYRIVAGDEIESCYQQGDVVTISIPSHALQLSGEVESSMDETVIVKVQVPKAWL